VIGSGLPNIVIRTPPRAGVACHAQVFSAQEEQNAATSLMVILLAHHPWPSYFLPLTESHQRQRHEPVFW